MLRLGADENFNNDIIRGLIRRKPDVDIVRVQDVGLSGADDPEVLESWSAALKASGRDRCDTCHCSAVADSSSSRLDQSP